MQVRERLVSEGELIKLSHRVGYHQKCFPKIQGGYLASHDLVHRPHLVVFSVDYGYRGVVELLLPNANADVHSFEVSAYHGDLLHV
jgi:hypothetical protein